MGDTERAKELWEEALSLFRELGDLDEIGKCIGSLGNVAISEGDLPRAVELYEEAACCRARRETTSAWACCSRIWD